MSTSNTNPPKPRKRFTGQPRGKNTEQQEMYMRKRASYQFYVERAKQLRAEGVPPFLLGPCLNMVHNWRAFGQYRINGYWASQSLTLLLKDIGDPRRLIDLKLN